jgi:hypothetical protein
MSCLGFFFGGNVSCRVSHTNADGPLKFLLLLSAKVITAIVTLQFHPVYFDRVDQSLHGSPTSSTASCGNSTSLTLATTSAHRETVYQHVLRDKRLSIKRSRFKLELLHGRIESSVVVVVFAVKVDGLYAVGLHFPSEVVIVEVHSRQQQLA